MCPWPEDRMGTGLEQKRGHFRASGQVQYSSAVLCLSSILSLILLPFQIQSLPPARYYLLPLTLVSPAHLFICIPFPYLSICVYILHQLHSRSAKLSSFVCLAFSSCICACLFPSLTPYPICLSFGRITRLDPLPVFFVWAISKIHVTLTLIVFVFKVCGFNSVSRHYKYDWTSWSGGDGRQRWREHDENPLGVDEYNRQLWVRERKRACVCGRKLKQGEMDGGSRGRASPARRPGPAQTDGDTEWPECVTRWQ